MHAWSYINYRLMLLTIDLIKIIMPAFAAVSQKEAASVDYLDAVQWPAMLVTVTASWYVASGSERRRKIGFWLFIVSNVAWVIWGVHTQAYALITLQVCLAFLNIRGVFKARAQARGVQ
jgi:hypothetical protein